MSDAALATSVAATDQIAVVQPNGIALATAAQVYATPMAAISALSATVVSQAQQIATLQAKPDPCVALSGAIPVATVQVGTVTVAVSVPGLLAADRVSVEPAADLPAGLVLAWAHPASDGVLTVALTASVLVAVKAPAVLNVTALR